jgi:hypothetical protein
MVARALPSPSMRTIPDPDGIPVELTDERWQHILAGHPDLRPHLEAVAVAIAAPTNVRSGRKRNERWHYLAEAGPSRWLKVVVAYEGSRGYVRTAFARRSFP